MKKILFIFIAFLPFAAAARIDPRENLNWADHGAFVRMGGKFCTGQYIAPDIVATAMHCIVFNGQIRANPTFITYDGKTCGGEIISGENVESFIPDGSTQAGDHVLIRVSGDECKNNRALSVAAGGAVQDGFVDNVGFGTLAVLSDEDLFLLRKKLKNIVDVARMEKPELVNTDAESAQMRGRWAFRGQEELLNKFIDSLSESDAGGPPVKNPFEDGGVLKIHRNCKVLTVKYMNVDGLFKTSCVAYGGNSGGAYLAAGTNNVVGIEMQSNGTLYELDFGAIVISIGVSSSVFYRTFIENR
jgi:hypothetical protein